MTKNQHDKAGCHHIPLHPKNGFNRRNITSDGNEKTPVLWCFQCNSEEDPSCEESGGGTVECPATGACVISSVSEHGKEDVFSRSCAPIRNTLKCDTVETEGQTLRYCNCGQDLCNWDWVSAGSTPAPTKEPTPSHFMTCYSCHNATEHPDYCSEDSPGKEVSCPIEGLVS